MKKLISLLLVVVFICSALVGCDGGSIFDKETSTTTLKWEAPEGMVETKVTDENGNLLTITHSNNFTQDDIDFVVMLHDNYKINAFNEPASYTLEDIIWNARQKSPIFLMHFENPYIIVAYLKPYQKSNSNEYNFFDTTKYLWCKFNDSQSIPNTIGDAKLTQHSYLLYDCIVEKDIINGVAYNKKCKYYLNYYDESSFNRTTNDMIVWMSGKNIGASDSKFIMESGIEVTQYEVFVDDNDKKYLVLVGEMFNSTTGETINVAQLYLGEHYDTFYPNFVRNDSLDRIEYLKNGGDYYEYRMIQIDLDVFTGLIVNHN